MNNHTHTGSADSAQPLVSVCITNYNNSQFLRDSVNSVLYQTYSNIELVFGDNASTDDSIAVFESLISDYEQASKSNAKLPTRKIVRAFRSENGGIHANRMTASQASTGEWVTFLDADDFLLSHGISKISDLFADELDIIQSPVSLVVPSAAHFASPLTSTEAHVDVDFSKTQGYDGPWDPQRPKVCSGPLAARYAYRFDQQTAIFSRLGLHATFFRTKLLTDVKPFLSPISPELAGQPLGRWPDDVYPDDFFLSLQLKNRARALAASPAKFYCYRVQQNSAVHSLDSRGKYALAEVNLLIDVSKYTEFLPQDRTTLARAAFGTISSMTLIYNDPIWHRTLNRAFFNQDSSLNIRGTELGRALGIKFHIKCWLVKAGLFKLCLNLFGGRLMAVDSKINEL